jgi:hypothetical protein
MGRGAIGLQDDPGPVGDDESVRAIVENLTRCGKLQLGPARLAPSVVALGAKSLGLRGEAPERLLQLPALDAQHFLMFRPNEPEQTLDARTKRLGVL